MRNERHRFDPFSLVFGLSFVTIGIAFGFGGVNAIDVEPLGLVAGVMLFIGMLLLAFLWRRRSNEIERSSQELEPDENL